MRNANGYGSVIKLAGNRRKPWACRKTVGFTFNEETKKSYPIYKYISYHATRKEAVQALAEYNKNPYTINSYTFKEVFEMWNNVTHTEKTYHRKFVNAFNKLPDLHDMVMRNITLKDLQYALDNMEVTKPILKHVKIMLKGVFEYAAKREIVSMASLEMIKLVDMEARKETRSVKRNPFSKSELEWLWNHKDDATVRQILVYTYTGMRFKELQSIKDEDVFEKEKYIDITKSKTDAGARIVPLSDKVLGLLPIDRIPKYEDFYYHFNTTMDLMGANHTIHDCRHTFITLMTEAGTDPRILKQIVGHSSGDVTEDVYTHVGLEKLLDAVNKI